MDSLLAGQSPPVYTDFSGLAALRQRARANPEQSLQQVAGQFESIFLQMMLKSMRDATIEGGLFDSSQMDLYQGMFDQQVSLDLSNKGSLGLADIIVRQYSAGQTQDRPAANTFERPAETAFARHSLLRKPSAPLRNLYASVEKTADWTPATPQEFIRGLWGHAVEAAAELQVAPEVLVAQSALETGWGQRMIRRGAGDNSFNLFGIKAGRGWDGETARVTTLEYRDNSFNLFGIKAGRGWDGETARVTTLEYRDGIAKREFAEFRAYPSLQASFADYVTFLQDQPRYQQALAKASDSRQFLQELQAAGYATDPQYASKIMGILQRTSVAEIVAELKNSAPMSLSNTALSSAHEQQWQ